MRYLLLIQFVYSISAFGQCDCLEANDFEFIGVIDSNCVYARIIDNRSYFEYTYSVDCALLSKGKMSQIKGVDVNGEVLEEEMTVDPLTSQYPHYTPYSFSLMGFLRISIQMRMAWNGNTQLLIKRPMK